MLSSEPFKVVVATMGLTHADAATVRDVLEVRAAEGDLALFLDTADDPVVQRILTPRVALTVAEHLAFDLDQHVLVIIADMTSYCEALREVSAARGEIPGRRAYPGYLYSDLASIYERCGRIRGRPGSLTLVPILTMPAGDITHPVADLTGYITEGQIVLDRALDHQGVYPPINVLASLSRLFDQGTGEGFTHADHPALAHQLFASYAKAVRVRVLASVVGADGLAETDRGYLDFGNRFERELVGQADARRLDDSLALGWQLLRSLPRRGAVQASRAYIRWRASPIPGSCWTASPALFAAAKATQSR